MKEKRIGIIGAGTMSEKHIDAYMQFKDAKITAICGNKTELARQKAEQYKIPNVYSDYNEMLKECKLDAVSVVTPNNTHAPITIAALNAGLHVLCEKPPAMNAEQSFQMAEYAKRNDCLLMYGMPFRFSEKTSVIRDLQQKGMFGEIYYGKTGIIRRCGNPGGWFCNSELARGGPLLDLGVHVIDLAMFIMGNFEPVSVYANVFRKIGKRSNIKGYSWYKSAHFDSSVNDVEDLAVATIKFKNGAILFVETSYASNIKAEKFYMDLLGDKAGITVEPGFEIYGENYNYLMDITPVLDDTTFNWTKAVHNEVYHFLDCIETGCTCLSPANDGIIVMKIIDAIYRSAETGNVVSISQ